MNKLLVSLFEYVLVFLMIISFNSVYVLKYQSEISNYVFISFVAVIIFLLLLNFDKLRTMEFSLISRIIKYYSFYITGIVMLVVVNFGATNKRLVFKYFLILFPLLTLLTVLYVYNGNVNSLLKKFSTGVVALACISLFFWLFGSILGFFEVTDRLLILWDVLPNYVEGYYNIYYETQKIDLLGFSGWRNTGIYVEGPMYNLILNLALVCVLFLEKYTNKVKIIVLVITIITTLSTTGYIFMGLAVGYKLYKKHKRFIVLWIPAISAVLLGYYYLIEDKSTTGSAAVRQDDYLSGINAWLDNFIFGHGIGNITSVRNYMDPSRTNLGYSNSFFSILIQGGIVLGIILLVPLIYLILSRRYGVGQDTKAVILLFIYLLITTIFDGTILFFFCYSLIIAVCILRNEKINLKDKEF